MTQFIQFLVLYSCFFTVWIFFSHKKRPMWCGGLQLQQQRTAIHADDHDVLNKASDQGEHSPLTTCFTTANQNPVFTGTMVKKQLFHWVVFFLPSSRILSNQDKTLKYILCMTLFKFILSSVIWCRKFCNFRKCQQVASIEVPASESEPDSETLEHRYTKYFSLWSRLRMEDPDIYPSVKLSFSLCLNSVCGRIFKPIHLDLK